MTKTPSVMIPLGTIAPAFSLVDTRDNKFKSLESLKSDIATVVMFICNHCPYVTHIEEKLVALVKSYQERGISFIAICSNDAKKYPADSPQAMRDEAEKRGFTFPYLHDETQEIAKAYLAACTPDIYVFDKNLACVYRGRFDESTPGNNIPVTGKDLSSALDNILAGKAIKNDQIASIGCNIKWKA